MFNEEFRFLRPGDTLRVKDVKDDEWPIAYSSHFHKGGVYVLSTVGVKDGTPQFGFVSCDRHTDCPAQNWEMLVYWDVCKEEPFSEEDVKNAVHLPTPELAREFMRQHGC